MQYASLITTISRPARGVALALMLGSLGLAGCASSPSSPAGGNEELGERDEQCGRCGEVKLVQRVARDHSPGAGGPDRVATGGVLSDGPLGGISTPLPSTSTRTGPVEYLDRVTIELDFGGMEVVEVPGPTGLRRGDRVRVSGNIIEVLHDDLEDQQAFEDRPETP